MTRSPAIPLRIRLIGAGAALILAPGLARAQCEVGVVSDALFPWFGTSADIDGGLAVIGVPWKERALVFRKEAGEWVQEAILTVPEAKTQTFAESVAISGDRVIAGDYQFPNGTGAAYVFRRTGPGSWILEGTVTPDDGHPGQRFGWAVDLDGEAAIVGARSDNELGKSAGAAYIFRAKGGAWEQEAKLRAPDGGEGHLFGSAVAISGGSAVVGAIKYPEGGRGHFFRHLDGTWQASCILGPFGTGEYQPKDFGTEVRVDHERIVLGAVFGSWVWVYRITDNGAAPEVALQSEPVMGCFGRAFALDGDRLLVGASCADEFGDSAGAAVLFDYLNGSWIQRSVFVGSQVKPNDWFGSFIALNGTEAIVGELQYEGLWSQAYFFDMSTGCLPCYADLDGSADLDLFDFLAFVNAFNVGESAADCDGNATFDIFDFFCFVNYFNEGC